MENQESLEDKGMCNESKNNSVVPYLAPGIISNIFTRLDAREIQKFRYGCREWYNLTSSSYFINTHLRHSKPGLIAIPASMIFPIADETQYMHPEIIQVRDEEVAVSSLKIKCKKFVQGACNGLVLLEDKENNLWVCNPVTNQSITLPCFSRRSDCTDIKRAIRFDDSTGKYKVMAFVYIKETGLIGCEILVLGSSTRRWVNSSLEFITNAYPSRRRFISIGRVFHILLVSNSGVLVSFDMVEEKFYKSRQLPFWCGYGELVEIDGCPSTVLPKLNSSFQWNIWVLKDLDTGIWDLHCTIDMAAFSSEFPKNWHLSRILGALENGRFLIIERGWHPGFEYYVYDVELQSLKTLELACNSKRYLFLPHVESLVAFLKP